MKLNLCIVAMLTSSLVQLSSLLTGRKHNGPPPIYCKVTAYISKHQCRCVRRGFLPENHNSLLEHLRLCKTIAFAYCHNGFSMHMTPNVFHISIHLAVHRIPAPFVHLVLVQDFAKFKKAAPLCLLKNMCHFHG